jgi:hypothetical protein
MLKIKRASLNCVERLNEHSLEDCLGEVESYSCIHHRRQGLSWFQQIVVIASQCNHSSQV